MVAKEEAAMWRIIALAACLVAATVAVCSRPNTRAGNSGEPRSAAGHPGQPEI